MPPKYPVRSCLGRCTPALVAFMTLFSACVSTTPPTVEAPPFEPIAPVQRTDPNSLTAHQQLVQKAQQGRIDVYFLGDSITRRWGATDYPHFLANWRTNFHGWNAGNFGWGGDTVDNMLWRIENGELDGVRPRVIVLLGGTNNVGDGKGGQQTADHVVRGIQTLLQRCREKAPDAKIILTAIFPRNDHPGANSVINEINPRLAKLADTKRIRFLDINGQLAETDGTLRDGMTVDKLHLDLKGYQVWADALKPMLTKLLGPPAAEDKAPPPTGDPSATR